MDDQIYFLKPDKVKVPVKPQVFKHGGGFYLAMVNHEAGVHIPFLAAAATLINELREILRVIEGAHNGNDQGHVNGEEARARLARQNPTKPNWDWLTPEMVIKYVEQSPVLHIYADDVRTALKPLMASTGHFVGTQTAHNPITRSQLELDLETVRPHLDRIKRGGKVNKSEIARVLLIPTGGSSWGRVKAVADVISSSTMPAPSPRTAQPDEKDLSAAA